MVASEMRPRATWPDRRGTLLNRRPWIALRSMIKAPVVDTNAGGLLDAQVIVPMADAPGVPAHSAVENRVNHPQLAHSDGLRAPRFGVPWISDAVLTNTNTFRGSGSRMIISLVMCTSAVETCSVLRKSVPDWSLSARSRDTGGFEIPLGATAKLLQDRVRLGLYTTTPRRIAADRSRIACFSASLSRATFRTCKAMRGF